MLNNKESKMFCVRIPLDLHNVAKSMAYSKGLTLQDWIISLIEKEIYTKHEAKTLDDFKTWGKSNEKNRVN